MIAPPGIEAVDSRMSLCLLKILHYTLSDDPSSGARSARRLQMVAEGDAEVTIGKPSAEPRHHRVRILLKTMVLPVN